MQLNDKYIHSFLQKGELVIIGPNPDLPFDSAKQVQPASIDLRLDNRIVRFTNVGDSFDINQLENIAEFMNVEYIEKKSPIKLAPQEIVFAQVYEQISIPNILAGRIEGRSRFARLGLSIHCTGDFINPGFAGAMPLQIVNHNSFEVIIYPYISICQLILYQLINEPLISYAERSSLPYNKYQGEKDASTSILHYDSAINNGFNNETIIEEKIRILINSYMKNMDEDLKAIKSRGTEPNSFTLNIFENVKEMVMRDKYESLQSGIQGANAGQHSQITINQSFINSIDTGKILEELQKILVEIQKRSSSEKTYDKEIESVSEAVTAAKENDKKGIVKALGKTAKSVLKIATEIGAEFVVKLIKTGMGL